MDTRTKGLYSGGIAFALAIAIILAATFLGFAPVGSRGVLSVLLTDPASVPSGVTAVFVTYDDLQVHAAGSPSTTWVGLNSKGTIETLRLVNRSEIISSASIPSGIYDSVSLRIAGCQVEFQGMNYSAIVDDNSLQAAFVGTLTLNPSGHSAALVDLQPTILNLGSTSEPQFLANAAAIAAEVPSGQVKLGSLSVGSKTSLASNGWFANFLANNTDRLTIGAASVTSQSISLDVNNPSRTSQVVKMIVITPVQGAAAVSTSANAATSPSLIDSTIFVVEGNGTLNLIHFIGPSVASVVGEVQQLTGSPGYELSSGASASFSYSGSMEMSFGGKSPFGSNTPNTFYTVTVLGNQVLARTMVKGS
jgi:hypothetical protein